MKNSGLFLNMAKWCLFFLGVLVLLWFVFGVFGIVPGVFKMLVFPVFLGGAFVGWLILAYFGFGRFRCFCVSCVCFCFLCCFCFCLFALLLFCCWIVFGVGSCFAFVLVFFSFFLFLFFLFFFVLFFFGGFKGQVRWPKGPPHLALNPPYFLFFVGFCFFLCFPFFVFFNRQKTVFP